MPTNLIADDYVPPRDDWMDRDGPIYTPQDPRWPGWQKNTNWSWASKRLTAEATKIVWVGPNLKWWDLAGNMRGRQGVAMVKVLQGMGLAPFEHKYSEGPYVPGATLERTDTKKRIINFGVTLNANSNVIDPHRISSSFRYRYLESLWWSSFSKTDFGYLGVFTRATGWRWIKCIVEADSSGDLELDPVALGNNSATYDMSLVAVDPYFYKPPRYKTWKNKPGKVELDGSGLGVGKLTIANVGTVTASPLYLITCPGEAQVSDGPDLMVPLPATTNADKFYLVDTGENAQTIQGSVDPVDNPFYRFIRQAGLADFFLHDLANQGLPLWRRWDTPQIFSYAIGPKEAVTTTVKHNYPNAEITMIVPQRYETAWS